MGINYLFMVLVAFLLSNLFIFILRKITAKYNLLKFKEIPLVGGIGMGLSFVLVSLIIFFLQGSLSKEALGIILSSLVMLVFGIIDDWREFPIGVKLWVQIIAASFLVFFGIKTQIVFLDRLFNLLVTFIWVLGITNAFNHLDVIDGLAAGTAMIISFAFLAISLLNADINNAVFSLALGGATLGFLVYNLPPAKIYMGNSGSHLLGFILAAIALTISYAPLERKVALLSPILILGLPIFDTAFLILMRIKNRRSVFRKSNDHLALRFLKLGYSKNKTLLCMLLLGLLFCFSGVVVSQVSNPFGITIIVSIVLVSFVLTKKMSKVVVND